MKPQGPHPARALNEEFIRTVLEPGFYGDGNSLYLRVDRSGAKRWILRTVVLGKRRDMGIGGLTTTSLTEARQKAHAYRQIARSGGDPFEARGTCEIQEQERQAGTRRRRAGDQGRLKQRDEERHRNAAAILNKYNLPGRRVGYQRGAMRLFRVAGKALQAASKLLGERKSAHAAELLANAGVAAAQDAVQLLFFDNPIHRSGSGPDQHGPMDQ